MDAFGVAVEPLDDGYRVGIAGELDLTTVEVLHEHLAYVAGRVVIDCSDLTFTDTSGINELAMLAKRVDSVVLVKPTEILCKVLEMLGLEELLPVAEAGDDPRVSE